jgi:tetraacyldisaccharide 4'-kinase
LFPFAIIYDAVTLFRNYFFELGLFKSYQIPVFSISVGNLSVGGTGKTPFISYLIQNLEFENIVVLSRGYGRKTHGYLEVDSSSTPCTVGDEVIMLFEKHKAKAKFFVSENRKIGILKILEKYPETEVILLDDAFQHRWVKPTLSILLSTFYDPFFSDYLLPFGRLREARKGAFRADLLIITKTKNVNNAQSESFEKKLSLFKNKEAGVFYAAQSPALPANLFGEILQTGDNVKVLVGLANNQTFVNQISKEYKIVSEHLYKDHYNYTSTDIYEVLNKEPESPIVTTEKDFVKIKFLLSNDELKNIFVQKLEINFLKDENQFLSNINSSFKRFQEEKGSLIIG